MVSMINTLNLEEGVFIVQQLGVGGSCVVPVGVYGAPSVTYLGV